MTVSDRDLRIIEECKASDEPCIVFRAQDVLLPIVLEHYLHHAGREGASPEFLRAVQQRWQEVVDWQEDTGKAKVPDLREGEATS